ncbi:MAG: PAC2 family protein [Thermoproteota archaeon]
MQKDVQSKERNGLSSNGVMSTTRLWLRRSTRFQAPTLIVGFPGIGRVGRIALKHLSRSLHSNLVGIVTSPYFSSQAIVTKDGSARLMRGEIYGKRLSSGEDLLLFSGDEHYSDIQGEYETSYKLLNFFKRIGGRMIVTIGGHAVLSEATPKVLCFATTKSLLQRALSAGAVQAPRGTPIVGISGVLVALAKLKEVPAVCLLGETLGLMPDFRAAKSVLSIVTKMLSLDIDLSPLDVGAGDFSKLLKDMEKQYDSLVQNDPIKRLVEETRGPGPDYVS